MIIRVSKKLFLNANGISLIIKTNKGLKIVFTHPLIEEESYDNEGNPIVTQLAFIELSKKKGDLFLEKLKPLGWDEDSLYEEEESYETEEDDTDDIEFYLNTVEDPQ